jgi:hypothetical protein
MRKNRGVPPGVPPCTLLPALTEHGQSGPGQELRSLRGTSRFHRQVTGHFSATPFLTTLRQSAPANLFAFYLFRREGGGGARNMLTKRSTGGPCFRFSSGACVLLCPCTTTFILSHFETRIAMNYPPPQLIQSTSKRARAARPRNFVPRPIFSNPIHSRSRSMRYNTVSSKS